MAKLELIRGDTWIIIVTVKDENGDVVDLSDVSQALFSLKTNKDDTTYLVEHAEGSIPAPESGEIIFTIAADLTDLVTPGEPTSYWYDVELTKNDGTIFTVVRDEAEIIYDITRPHEYGSS